MIEDPANVHPLRLKLSTHIRKSLDSLDLIHLAGETDCEKSFAIFYFKQGAEYKIFFSYSILDHFISENLDQRRK